MKRIGYLILVMLLIAPLVLVVGCGKKETKYIKILRTTPYYVLCEFTANKDYNAFGNSAYMAYSIKDDKDNFVAMKGSGNYYFNYVNSNGNSHLLLKGEKMRFQVVLRKQEGFYSIVLDPKELHALRVYEDSGYGNGGMGEQSEPTVVYTQYF